MKILSILAAGLAMVSLTTNAATKVELCYSDRSATPEWFGTGKSETYDVAVFLNDPGMVGARITGLKVPVQKVFKGVNPTAWLSSELKLATNEQGKKTNSPDITTTQMSVEDGYLVATFSTPYVIPAQGVYAGYSFTMEETDGTDATVKPVAVSKGTNTNAFFLHTSKQYLKWRECSKEKGLMTYITVLAEGDFAVSNAGLKVTQPLYYSVTDENMTVPVELVFHGQASLNDFECAFDYTSADGKQYKGTAKKTFDTPQEVQFGHSLFTDIDLPGLLPKGIYQGTLTLTSINDQENTDQAAIADLKFEVVSRVPVHKPVMEEYTGMWCGYCTRGYASLEHMSKNYPNFIGISYHYDDVLHVVDNMDYPNKVTGFPAAYLDREVSLDAYHGTEGEGYGFVNDWKKRQAKFSPIDVYVEAAFDPKNPKVVNANTKVTFVQDTKMSYKIAYILLADGLKGDEGDTEWDQRNYLAGNTAYMDIPEMLKFVENLSGYVSGLVYDDILVGHGNLLGEENSIPWPVEVDKAYDHSFSFDTDKCLNVMREPVIQDLNKLRVVALVIDSNGYIANANVCKIGANSSVSEMTKEEPVSTVYYDLQGRRVRNDAHGILIQMNTDANGKVSAKKIVK